MTATVISLVEYRELLQQIEAEALEVDPQWLELAALDAAINEGLIWVDVARDYAYPPLCLIKGGKYE